MAIGARVVAVEGRKIHVIDDDNQVRQEAGASAILIRLMEMISCLLIRNNACLSSGGSNPCIRLLFTESRI